MAKNDRLDSPAARRGKRIALVTYVALGTAFVVFSTTEIARQVFGPAEDGPAPSAPCAAAGREFEGAIDQALQHAAAARDPGTARDRFRESLGHGAALAKMEQTCAASSPDRDTLVAARRLQEAAESAAGDESATLARLRRSLEARAVAR